MLTVQDIANELTSDRLSADQAANRFRRLVKLKVAKGIGKAGGGATAAHVFPDTAPAVAKIIFAYYDLGITDPGVLASVWVGLSEGERPGDPPPIVRLLADAAAHPEPRQGPVTIITAYAKPDGSDYRLGGDYRLSNERRRPIDLPTDDHEVVGHATLELNQVLRAFAIKQRAN